MTTPVDKAECYEPESRLDAAVQAVLAEPVPADAVERVKTKARKLDCRVVSRERQSSQHRAQYLPVARYGGVALAVFGAVIVFTLLADRTAVWGFADVIQNVEQARSVQLKMTTQLGHGPQTEGRMFIEGDQLRVEQAGGALIHVIDFNQGNALILDTHRKLAQAVNVDEQMIERLSNPIRQLRDAVPDEAQKIGEEYLKDRLTMVYRLRSIELFGMHGKGEMFVWVDRDSELPVKIVIRDPDPKAATEVVFEEFVWNKPLDPQLFSLKVPSGFESGIVMTVPPQQPPAPTVESLDSPDVVVDGVVSRDRVPSRVLWDPQSTSVTALLREPESAPDAARYPHELRRWNVATGKLQWRESVGGASSLAQTTDGRILATAIGQELQLRDAATGTIIRKWATDSVLPPLDFSPDGETLAAGIASWGQRDGKPSGGVQIWDAARGTLVRSVVDDKPTTFVRYSADGRYVASASNGGPVKLWDVATGELARIFPGWRPDFSPDGRTIACASATKTEDGSPISSVEIYDIETGSHVMSLTSRKPSPNGWLLWVEFSPDGQLLATADWDGSFALWDIAARKRTATITEHQAGVHTAVFSPDGAMLATGSEDRTLRLWNLQELLGQ